MGGSTKGSQTPRWPGLILLAAVLACLLAITARLVDPAPRPSVPPSSGSATATTATATYTLPAVRPRDLPPVVAGPRGVPPSIAATADVQAAPWAPGLRLEQTDMKGRWEVRRAVVRDMTTEDRRSYAIGDLLPHGSLLVGISTGAVQVLVADRELVELRDDGKLRSLEDFRAGYEARPLRRAPDLADEYVAGAERALATTLVDDPQQVQAAIDALIAAGEPAVELVLPKVSSTAPVVPRPYAFPSPDGPRWTPRVQGDIAIGVLEAVTGQSFGDVFDPAITPAQREAAARAWRRWWGLE